MGKKILVVDDSALMRKLACDIIKKDGRYDAPDTCRNGEEALEKVKKNKYDAIVLDVYMPVMDGLEFLRQLKKEGLKERVMMFSTTTGEGTSQTIEALDLGAIDFIKKPDKFKETSGEDFAQRFLKILEVVAQAGSVPSAASARKTVAISSPKAADQVAIRPSEKIIGEKIVAIASSTGGPKALHSVIPLLPANLNAPVILVQHMPPGFTKSLAERLDSLGPISVKEAEEGDLLEKGKVYIAPGGKHMKVTKSAGGHVRIFFSDEPHREGVKPCANYMYESLLDTDYAGVCCVVLTGMGMDGTEGIKNLEKGKKVHIISQDEASCAVYGMPKAIAQTGLVNEVLPLEKIAIAITKEIGTK